MDGLVDVNFQDSHNTQVLLVMPSDYSIAMLLGHCWVASGMFASVLVDCNATMRIICASLVRRVRGSTNNILKMISSRQGSSPMFKCVVMYNYYSIICV